MLQGSKIVATYITTEPIVGAKIDYTRECYVVKFSKTWKSVLLRSDMSV